MGNVYYKFVYDHLRELNPPQFFDYFGFSYKERKLAQQYLSTSLKQLSLNIPEIVDLAQEKFKDFKKWKKSQASNNYWLKVEMEETQNEFQVNENKRKRAEDEVHTSSIVTSAELLKDTLEHHRKNTKQKLDTPATPMPHYSKLTPTITSNAEYQYEISKYASDNEMDIRNMEFDQYVDDEYFIQERLSLSNSYSKSYILDEANDIDVHEKDISMLLSSYRSEAYRVGETSGFSIVTNYHEILSLSSILLLQADKFSDLQVKKFSRDTLTSLRKKMCDMYAVKVKVTSAMKSIFREYIEIAIDEDLGLPEAEKAIKKSFTKTFSNPVDQNMFDMLQNIFLQLTKNIPIKPLNDLLSEGTLTANIVSPVLRSFFHDATFHPTTWPNTASMSAKARKLANLDPSRAKQPDMIGSVINNNTSAFELMFGENTGEGKNNNIRKNTIDIIRLGIFMKDALDNIIKNTGRSCVVFGWQTVVVALYIIIVTTWTGYMMVLIASGTYIMFEVGQAEFPRSFRTCGQFVDSVDNLFTFGENYKREVHKIYNYINEEKADSADHTSWRRPTLTTPQFRKLLSL
ncbi:346_t:CDS:10 [Paraglomus brasilianum]|uniref:346_t:CDS:1 n=1 Tax=Paraglomus brasilianum TaxID=144538 RepID=A0A9N9AY02_9GLOM|nr:346_t:CDS:10 [Paraglomus brasilianum]